MVEMLNARVVEPAHPDLLFEIWAALATLSTLEKAGWQRQAVTSHEQGTGRAPGPLYATMAGGDPVHLAVYTQYTPVPWRKASRYAATFQRYGLAGGMRRPDMVIEIRQGRDRHWILVEVKRTVDPGYIADSIYKVLGYIADFQTVLANSPEPHALLLVWDMPRLPRDNTTDLGPVAVASASTYRDVLAHLLARM